MFVHFVTHTLSLPISCRVYDTNLVNALHMTNHMRDLQFIYICMKVATIMYKNRRQSSTQKTRTIQTVTVKKKHFEGNGFQMENRKLCSKPIGGLHQLSKSDL